MVEPVITIGLGVISAYLAKDGLQKLLGPTAEYLGEGLQQLTQRRLETIGKIFANAHEKAGEDIENPGIVNPKVLNKIINDASYCDSDIAVDYFGGILASSRTQLGRDDRGARMAKIVEGLSTYQLRAHFLIYSTFRSLYKGSNVSFSNLPQSDAKIFMSFQGFHVSMDFVPDECKQVLSILNHTFYGLHAESLIGPEFGIGTPEKNSYISRNFLDRLESEEDEHGIVCSPSPFGVELYLWAFGKNNMPNSYITAPEFCPRIDGLPWIYVAGSLKLS